MTEAVVDLLEAVHVDKEYGEAALLPRGIKDGLLQPLGSQPAVGKLRQQVEIRLVTNTLFLLFAETDVGAGDDVVRDLVVAAAHGRDRHGSDKRRARQPPAGDFA